MLELVDQDSPERFKTNLDRMLNGCLCLEVFFFGSNDNSVAGNLGADYHIHVIDQWKFDGKSLFGLDYDH